MNISPASLPPDGSHAASPVLIFTDCPRELPIRVPETQSAFHPRLQRNASRCRDVRLQSRLFARWHPRLIRSPNSIRPAFRIALESFLIAGWLTWYRWRSTARNFDLFIATRAIHCHSRSSLFNGKMLTAARAVEANVRARFDFWLR